MNFRSLIADSDTVWRLPAADAWRGYRALCWSAGPTGELVTVTRREERRIPVEDVRFWPSHLALLPDARFLLVRGRTIRNEAEGYWAPNAVVLAPSGTPESEFCVGDDIPALVTDADGGI